MDKMPFVTVVTTFLVLHFLSCAGGPVPDKIRKDLDLARFQEIHVDTIDRKRAIPVEKEAFAGDVLNKEALVAGEKQTIEDLKIRELPDLQAGKYASIKRKRSKSGKIRIRLENENGQIKFKRGQQRLVPIM